MNWSEYMKETCGYTTVTTFWDDFTIAEKYNLESVKDTYKRAFDEWHTDTKFITELVMVLNYKMWQHADENKELGLLYKTLWEECEEWCWNNLEGEDLDYFYKTID